ncbi:hypothetical protein BC628DRAFT_91169 [Trametes gibbosa]|nr:hypothetical protein BC628DRAFT_91169 [Trametes gibbosa]
MSAQKAAPAAGVVEMTVLAGEAGLRIPSRAAQRRRRLKPTLFCDALRLSVVSRLRSTVYSAQAGPEQRTRQGAPGRVRIPAKPGRDQMTTGLPWTGLRARPQGPAEAVALSTVIDCVGAMSAHAGVWGGGGGLAGISCMRSLPWPRGVPCA